MQYINNKKREELKKEWESSQLNEDETVSWWLYKAEELVAERVQAILEELVETVTKDGTDYVPVQLSDILSLPSLTPKK